jgi:hypothetical protein
MHKQVVKQENLEPNVVEHAADANGKNSMKQQQIRIFMGFNIPPSAISKHTLKGCACYGHWWVAVVIII